MGMIFFDIFAAIGMVMVLLLSLIGLTVWLAVRTERRKNAEMKPFMTATEERKVLREERIVRRNREDRRIMRLGDEVLRSYHNGEETEA